MSLREKVHAGYLKLVASKLQTQQQALQDLVDSAGSETKSSAGDKYETGRAMLHMEQDNIRQQMAETLAQKALLNAIDPHAHHERIGLGSVVRSTNGYYYLSAALGKLIVEGQAVMALSLKSPLGAKLAGLQVGDSVVINERELIIKEVW